MELMELGDFDFAIVDTCPTCGGSWFDRGELNEVAKTQLWQDVEHHPYRNVTGDHRHAMCPTCGDVELTAKTPQGDFGLIVDRCGFCGGFWLDKGETARILRLHDEAEDDFFEGTPAKDMTPQQILDQRPADWSYLKWMLYVFVHTTPKG